ncbi:hypothetical protein [Henriciella litoralis]|uniref:hypothetical protein n=1 Tax=Henriciella litoralis TaxID=568102 RepID=UPI0009FC8F4F|nr:hypothetical protein [Henriciella litoralis]
MSFKSLLVAGAGIAMALSATAQISSSGLGDVDAWNTNLLDRGETKLSDRMWASSDSAYLLSLMQSLDVEAMTQAERNLLSLVLRSPSTAPDDDAADALQAERLSLLYALGDRGAVSTLGRQVDDLPDGIDPDIVVADNRLARGELDVVCAQMDPQADGKFWSELRTVCALNDDNMAAAELAIEFAGQREGADPWVVETAIALIGDMDERPKSRFRTGLDVALSDLAALDMDDDSLKGARPDIAANVARDETYPIAFRLRAARIAADAGLFDSGEYRGLYDILISEDGFEPSTPVETALVVLAREPEPKVIPLGGDTGLQDLRSLSDEDLALLDEGAEPVDEVSLQEEQAQALAAALRSSASNMAQYRLVARLFEPELKAMPVNEDTAANALVFARAALMLGNDGLANHWIEAEIESETAEETVFETTLLRGYSTILARSRTSRALSNIAGILLEEGLETAEREETIRLFTTWSGLGVPVPVEARIALAETELDASGTLSRLAAMDAAERNGATGEALLLLLNETAGAPDELSGIELVMVLRLLKRVGADDAALSLAMEAADIW